MKNEQAKTRLVEDTKMAVLVGFKESEGLSYKMQLELAERDLEDFFSCVKLLSAEMEELKEKLKGFGAAEVKSTDYTIKHPGPSENFNEKNQLTLSLKKEIKKLKHAYRELSSRRETEFSALLAEKDFVWNQFRKIESDFTLFKGKHTEADNQAREAANKLQDSVEKLRKEINKDEIIFKLEAERSMLELNVRKHAEEAGQANNKMKRLHAEEAGQANNKMKRLHADIIEELRISRPKKNKMAESFIDFDDFFKNVYELGNINQMIESVEWDKINNFEYQGFDISRILSVFWVRAKNFNKSIIKKDIADILCVALMRANIRLDQLDRITEDGRKRIQELIERYKIEVRKSALDKIRMTPDTITFVRTISMFPLHASILIYKRKTLGEKIILTEKHGANNCPHELRHVGAASIIPKHQSSIPYIAVHVGYMMTLGENIDQKNISVLERYESQMRFAMISYNSVTIPDEKRVAAFKCFGLDKEAIFLQVIAGMNKLKGEIGGTASSVESLGAKILNNKVIIASDDLDKKAEASMSSLKRAIVS